jgi:hypothetical protein
LKPIRFTPILSIVLLALTACTPAVSPQEVSAISTSAAQTVQVLLSPPVTSTATQPRPSESPTAQATPTQSLSAPCEESATYTAWTRDNVVYDAKEVDKLLAPNKTFLMTWTLQNTGTCTWTSVYKMVFDSGTSLTGSANFPILPNGETVAPGGTVTVNITMSAPAEVGEYQSSFSLQNEQGKAVATYGVITKVGVATTQPSTQSLSSPGDLRYAYDCTSGSVSISLSWVDRANGEDGYRVYRNGARVADLAAGATAYSEFVPGSGTYNYSVAAYNSSGEFPTQVVVSTSNC